MTIRPILFSGPMVRALLSGGKTQTRRVVSVHNEAEKVAINPWDGEWRWAGADLGGNVPVRFAIGDRLYVREHWRTSYNDDWYDEKLGRAPKPSELDPATTALEYLADDTNELAGKDRRAMHMPRWASRITLTVTDVRVQRLQEISEADALAEGIVQYGRFFAAAPDSEWDEAELSAVAAYRRLWNHLNAQRGFGWATNPWVVAVSFIVALGNVDRVPA